jgi:putative transposase
MEWMGILMNRRKQLRLKHYDYSQPGSYFITLCSYHNQPIFGDVVGNEMILNQLGKIVEFTWRDLPNHVSGIELDAFVIMPNHIHGIITIIDRTPNVGGGSLSGENLTGSNEPPPTLSGRPVMVINQKPLSEIVRQLKTFSAQRINRFRGTKYSHVWQRDYFERVIRNEIAYQKTVEYIHGNPLKWHKDKYYFQ